MPYADPAKNNACKRAWERRQKALKTPYWQRKQRRVMARKWAKRRAELSPIYVKHLMSRANRHSGTPVKDVLVKREELKRHRIKRVITRGRRGLVFLMAVSKIPK